MDHIRFPVNSPASVPRRDLLYLLLAFGMGQFGCLESPFVEEHDIDPSEFVIIDGWVLPRELFGRA
jgi:hypothetical protein